MATIQSQKMKPTTHNINNKVPVKQSCCCGGGGYPAGTAAQHMSFGEKVKEMAHSVTKVFSHDQNNNNYNNNKKEGRCFRMGMDHHRHSNNKPLKNKKGSHRKNNAGGRSDSSSSDIE